MSEKYNLAVLQIYGSYGFLESYSSYCIVQITFTFICRTHLVFGKCICTCVRKHSNAFRTSLNWLKNFGKDIGDWRTIDWELGSLGRMHASCHATLSFCLDGKQIKGRETVLRPCWVDDILFIQCVSVRGTPVGVVAPVGAAILVIGLSNRVGSTMGRSEWLSLVSRWAWLWCHQISMRRITVICPGVFGIGYNGRALTGSSSLDTAPVTGSLLFNARVCHLAVCCAAGFSSCVLCGGGDNIWLAVFPAS